MPVRGVRNSFPSKGGSPTGMFSSKGRQKQDGASGPNMSTLKHAHAGGGEKMKPKSNAAPRHQAPAGGKSTRVSLDKVTTK